VGALAEIYRSHAGRRSGSSKVLKIKELHNLEKREERKLLFLSRDGRLDLLIGDTPILDYYRANDPGCTLRTVDVIEEDNYAVGMAKGLHLQVRGCNAYQK